MLSNIKKDLLKEPNNIIKLLEHYDYKHIKLHNKYISFARSMNGSAKSIVIRLESNTYLYVTDYAKNISKDLIAYIMEQRNVDFTDVLNTIKSILGISNYYNFYAPKRGIFGGIYDKVKQNKEQKIITYSDEILVNYERIGNMKFLRDNISLGSQSFFDIRYDEESNGIVIPIRTQTGEIMGIKVRNNFEDENIPKYWYLLPCQMSLTLYGFSQNYKYLCDNTIYVFEAEKSVQQCYTYGIRNCVALGSGTISNKQIEMILECHPKKVIFMHDSCYEYENIEKNMNNLRNYSRFSELEVGYWDWENSLVNLPKKSSPSDYGKDTLVKIMKTEIKML